MLTDDYEVALRLGRLGAAEVGRELRAGARHQDIIVRVDRLLENLADAEKAAVAVGIESQAIVPS